MNLQESEWLGSCAVQRTRRRRRDAAALAGLLLLVLCGSVRAEVVASTPPSPPATALTPPPLPADTLTPPPLPDTAAFPPPLPQAAAPTDAQAAPPAEVDPRKAELIAGIRRAAESESVPPDLAEAVAYVESRFTTTAVGLVGEVGLMQIMFTTAQQMGYLGSIEDLFESETNIRYSVKYLAGGWRLTGGDFCRTLVKYRAGWGETAITPRSVWYCHEAYNYLKSRGSHLIDDVVLPEAPSGYVASAAGYFASAALGGVKRVAGAHRGGVLKQARADARRAKGGVPAVRLVVSLAMPGFLAPPGTWTANRGLIVRQAPTLTTRRGRAPKRAAVHVRVVRTVAMGGFLAPPGTWKLVHAPRSRRGGNGRQRA